MCTQPTLSPGYSARLAEAAAMSPTSFNKRYRPTFDSPSSSSSPTLPLRKRYRGTSEPVLDTEDEEEESSDEGDEVEDTDEESAEDQDIGIGLEGTDVGSQGIDM